MHLISTRTLKHFVLVAFVGALAMPFAAAQIKLPPAASRKVDYKQDIQPLLAQKCYSCHGPEVQQAGLRLDLRQNALRGGDYGPVIKTGDSAASKLIRRVVDGDGGLQMPPTGPLSDEEIGLLRAWIDQGTEFRTDIVAEAPRKPVDAKVTALIAAVRAGNRLEIERQIAASPQAILGKDEGGSTALHHAAGYGPAAVVEGRRHQCQAGAGSHAAVSGSHAGQQRPDNEFVTCRRRRSQPGQRQRTNGADDGVLARQSRCNAIADR
jgi:mono/diheme cytochrome c family protein